MKDVAFDSRSDSGGSYLGSEDGEESDEGKSSDSVLVEIPSPLLVQLTL